MVFQMEVRIGTNPNDGKNHPGSAENQILEQETVNDVKVTVIATTTGNITMETITSESVPEIPESVGTSFDFFLNITADEAISEIYIELELGPIGGPIIPKGTDPNKIKLFYFDDEANEWVEVKDSSYNSKTGILWAKLDHLTIFAPMASKKGGEKDNGGGGIGDIAIFIVIIVIVIIVILALLGIVVKKGKKAKGSAGEDLGRIQSETRVDEPRADQPPTNKDQEPSEDATSPPEPAEELEPDASEPTQLTPPSSPEEPDAEPSQETEQESISTETTTPSDTIKAPPSDQDIPTPEPPEPESSQEPEQPPEEPKTTQTPAQEVPCPICKKMMPVYTTPCPHCGTNMNW